MLQRPDGDPNSYRPLPQYGRPAGHRSTRTTRTTTRSRRFSAAASSKFSYTRRLHVVEGAGHPRRRPGGQGRTQPAGDIRDSAYGILGYDRTHVLNVGYSYLLPDLEGGALKQALLGGWQFTGVSTYISGAPLQALATTGANFGLDGTLASGAADQQHARSPGRTPIAAMPVLTCDPTQGLERRPDRSTRAASRCRRRDRTATTSSRTCAARATSTTTSRCSRTSRWAAAASSSSAPSFTNVFNHPQRFLDDNIEPEAALRPTACSPAPGFGVLPRDNKYGRRIVQLAFKFYF